DLSEKIQDEMLAQLTIIETFGPLAKRPKVDTLKGSQYANMKELRFDAAGGIWRVAFAFDTQRKGIVSVAGNKVGRTGKSERKFYSELIRTADRRFKAHLDRAESARGATRIAKSETEGELTMTTLKEKIASLPPSRRKKIGARAAQLMAEELTLQDLRKAIGRTQTDLAKKLDVGQDTVSRVERRTDLLLSTLRGYVTAMG